ncbi:hypothetical protein [Escherichia coli]|uniref:hypothetical protein n=1 Tax=Escherichia coli TaxID=562 RepID=UPI000AB39581|nr:hypothetical protein [Escherichia coli]
MTVNDRSIPEDVYQSFSVLRSDIEGLCSLMSLIPSGEPDVFDYDSLGSLLRMISCCLSSDFEALWRSVSDAEFVKR